MKKLMIITLGTGQGVEYGLAKSIVVNNPEAVIFLLTQQSLAQHMPDKIRQIMQAEYHHPMPTVYALPRVVTHETDVQEVYQAMTEAILLAHQHGYPPAQVYLDFTSGTKAMSVGAALAAFLNGCRTMVYVGGFTRDPQTGRVQTGSEIVMTFTLGELTRIFGNYAPHAINPATVFAMAPHTVEGDLR